MDLVRDTIAMFQNRFGGSPQCLVTAPGRVNLIGEHTDYNEGFVLPAAIDKLTVVAAGRGSDNQLRMYSKNVDSMVGVSLDDLQPRRDDAWVNYITGVAFFLQLSGVRLQAANLCINGDIPLGTGLSSSASLEIASAFVFRCLSDFQHSELELIKLCQRAENEFVGVHCGIMDQFICCLGKANHALFLDCRDLSYQHIPFPGGVRLVVCDTGVRRGLASSEYNRRREECTEGVKKLSTIFPGIKSLRDISIEQFLRNEQVLDPIVRKRCRHVISENDRVRKAVEAVKKGDLPEFGKLMYLSHLSLKNDYEVSCPELDTVVDIGAEVEGVYGTRMTGAGFGGSALSLVQEGHVDELESKLYHEYQRRVGAQPATLVCTIEDGVKFVSL